MVWVWTLKISPKNVKFSNFSLRVKKSCFGSGRKVPGSQPGRPLIYCGPKVSSGRVRAHLYCNVYRFFHTSTADKVPWILSHLFTAFWTDFCGARIKVLFLTFLSFSLWAYSLSLTFLSPFPQCHDFLCTSSTEMEREEPHWLLVLQMGRFQNRFCAVKLIKTNLCRLFF